MGFNGPFVPLGGRKCNLCMAKLYVEFLDAVAPGHKLGYRKF